MPLPEILQYDFMLRALLAGVVVGIVAPAVGLLLVIRRLSLLGEGLGHAAFAGVAFGWLLGAYPPLTAMGFAALVAVGIEKLRGWQKLHGDVALAIFLYTSLALGMVAAKLGKGFGGEVISYLFGSIVTTTSRDLPVILVVGAVVLGTLLVFRGEFFAIALDEEAARVAGIPVNTLNLVLMVLTAVTVAVAMRVAGTLLVAGLMVIPTACALQLHRGFYATMALAMIFGVLSVLAGLLASFYLDLPSGGAVVLASTGLLLILMLVGQCREWWRQVCRRAPYSGSQEKADHLKGPGGIQRCDREYQE